MLFFLENFPYIEQRFDELTNKCKEKLNSQGFVDDHIKTEHFLNMRYQGSDGAIMIRCSAQKMKNMKYGDFAKYFTRRYLILFLKIIICISLTIYSKISLPECFKNCVGIFN